MLCASCRWPIALPLLGDGAAVLRCSGTVLTAGAAKLSKDMHATATMKVLGGIAIYGGGWIGLVSAAIGWFGSGLAAPHHPPRFEALAVAGLFAVSARSRQPGRRRDPAAVRSAAHAHHH